MNKTTTSAIRLRRSMSDQFETTKKLNPDKFVPFIQERDSIGRLLTKTEVSTFVRIERKRPPSVPLVKKKSEVKFTKHESTDTPGAGTYYHPINWVKPSFWKISKPSEKVENKEPLVLEQKTNVVEKPAILVYTRNTKKRREFPRKKFGLWESIQLQNPEHLLDRLKYNRDKAEYNEKVKDLQKLRSDMRKWFKQIRRPYVYGL